MIVGCEDVQVGIGLRKSGQYLLVVHNLRTKGVIKICIEPVDAWTIAHAASLPITAEEVDE